MNLIRLVTTIILISYSYLLLGQTNSIKVKKQVSDHLILSLAKVTEGVISIDSIIADPNIRIENAGKDSITIRKCLVVFNINGVFTDISFSNRTKLSSEEINRLKSVKQGSHNQIAIREIVALNKEGKEIFIEPVILSLKP